MMDNTDGLQRWIQDIAVLIEQSEHLDPEHYAHFLQEPELALRLVDLIETLDESEVDADRAYYSACVFALEICVAQLQSAAEAENKLAAKRLNELMSHMAAVIRDGNHSLSFWLPVLNAFYEVHVELSDELKVAYFNLANEDDVLTTEDSISHLDAIRDLIEELSDLSIFDIAENFFAQSYAMPADFFADLVIDLYSIKEGQDIALLHLLHPKEDVRAMVVATLDLIIDKITLNSLSLSRLQTIKNWYPSIYHEQFDFWIKKQRKKGVLFPRETSKKPFLDIKASEVDGSGAQGIFIHFKKNRKSRLCGLLFKQEVGIKDAWITPVIPAEDVARYYDESFDGSVMLRSVDRPYLELLTNHFLAVTIERGHMPDLHLLEMQEALGLQFIPRKLNVVDVLQQLTIQLSPFTPERMREAFIRSKSWPKNKRFTESWFVENAQIDRLVNRFCSYVEGVKVCRFDEAMAAVFADEMELHRERWIFHFLWVSLWLKPKARNNERTWQDCLFIAYAIHTGLPLDSIPIMKEICYQSVVNSIETMQERRTYLTGES
ncbi:hypothetical protein [Legionella nagasakiensis]|uniref:hypothetical protein n=1 Tax=Legionella nagasakiensis TaxID=535290 RepID=UPI00105587CA|nr:hypothetical protein [Legionella nagasakiensis]